jgi:hypothetical protein
VAASGRGFGERVGCRFHVTGFRSQVDACLIVLIVLGKFANYSYLFDLLIIQRIIFLSFL